LDQSVTATRAGVTLPVHAATRATVTLNVRAPKDAQLVIEYQRNGRFLARECRPLDFGTRAQEIKTHPDSTHIVCTLTAGDHVIEGVRYDVECGEDIEPTGHNFIVIGAMKAGTTTLFHLLVQHPEICRTYVELPQGSGVKELNYFYKVYREGDTAINYDWLFPFDPARHAWTLDVSPNYAKFPMGKPVPRRIAALGGHTKLAYILREPVDRIESHFAHTLRKTGKNPDMSACIQNSSYAQQMDRFTAHIPRDNILLLDFNELQGDTAATQIKVCDFLGIERCVAQTIVHNTRGIDFRLDPAKRAELANILRPDVQRLVDHYGFKPAKKWLQSET
jgi:hypothetical protein